MRKKTTGIKSAKIECTSFCRICMTPIKKGDKYCEGCYKFLKTKGVK